MGYCPPTAADIRDNLAEQLDWQFAQRDDKVVAQALHQGRAIDAVHTLDEVGLLDGFFAFVEETEIMKHWQSFHIEAVERVFIPAIYFVLLYGVRVLLGIESTNALPSLLFSNVAIMSFIGFTAYQVSHGLTRRGAQQRTGQNEYALMDPQTLAETICKSSAAELGKLFNGTIHCLARFGVFMAEAMVVVDGTPVPTPKSYQGCGCQKKYEKKRDRQGQQVKVLKLGFGWRLIALVDLMTLVPLAIKVVQIQSHEAPYLLGLVKQAQQNLAPYSRIRLLVVDRAYVDGPTLYALGQMGIKFVVLAKTTMKVYRTALHQSKQALIHERVVLKRHGHGQQAWSEKLTTRACRVTNIRDWDNYRPPKQSGKRLRRHDRPALNAVVVRQWLNEDPTHDQARVYLTNLSVANPWSVVDLYDDRSWIENGLFRNSKQFWRLTRWFPQKNEAGVQAHLTFVMMMVAVTTAYRLWQKQQASASHHPDDHQISQTTYHLIDPETGEVIDDPTPPSPSHSHLASSLPNSTAPADDPAQDVLAHSLLAGQGPARWRRQLYQHNRDKVIVFVGHHYGIFDIHELLLLSNVPVNSLPPHLDSRQDILRRYDCLPNPP
jgi:hypothetical protein